MTITSCSPPSSNPWIISRSQDLIWFQGSVIVGLILLLLFVLLPDLDSANYSVVHPAVLILLVWGVIAIRSSVLWLKMAPKVL